VVNAWVCGVCDAVNNWLGAVARVASDASSKLTVYWFEWVDENKAPVMDVIT